MKRELERTFIILNPVAGDGQARGRWEKFRTELDSEGIPYEVQETESRNHAAEIASEAINKGITRIAVFSGDGTLNEVLQGIMENDRVKNPDLKLIFLPAGSSCDFEKKFEKRKTLLERIQAHTFKPIDVFKVECRDFNGSQLQRYIVNNSSIGVISLANEKFNSVSGISKKIKQWSVDTGAVLSGIKALIEYLPFNCDLEIGQEKFSQQTLSNITVFKTSHFGGDMHYGIKPVQDDGQLSTVVLESGSRLNLFSMMPALFMGTVLKRKTAAHYYSTHVKVVSDDNAFVETDGENIGYPPAVYSILPKALNVIV